MTSDFIIKSLHNKRLSLHNEKKLQKELLELFPELTPEFALPTQDSPIGFGVIDFYNESIGIGVEVKIKGGKKAIYRQCARYCNSPIIKELILITNRSMGLPSEINGKPCHVVNIGLAWL